MQANPGVNIAALRPYLGYGAIRLSENAGRSIYNSLQISADRRYTNGFKFGFAYTLGKSEDNGSSKRNVLFNTYDDTGYWGPSQFDRRHVLAFYYIYDLPFFREQDTLMKNLLGGWQVSGATFMRSGTPFSVYQRSRDTRAWAMRVSASHGRPGRRPGRDELPAVHRARHRGVQHGRLRRARPPARSATRRGTRGTTPASSSGISRCSRTSRLGGTRRLQFRAEAFNFINHPNLGSIDTGDLQGQNQADPLSGNFGRITSKSDNPRDIQLSVRFQF